MSVDDFQETISSTDETTQSINKDDLIVRINLQLLEKCEKCPICPRQYGNKYLYCPLHLEAKMLMVLYCTNCRQDICHECTTSSKHFGHDVISSSLKENYELKFSQVEEKSWRLIKARDDCQLNNKLEMRNFKDVSAQIESAFQNITFILKAKRLEIVASLNKEKNFVMEKFNKRMRELGGWIGEMEKIRYGNCADVLSKADQLLSNQPTPTDGTVQFEHLLKKLTDLELSLPEALSFDLKR